MKWILMFAALLTCTVQAEVWTCEMHPRVLGEPRHGETVTHTFTRLPPLEENGYVPIAENFTAALEYNVEWIVIRENEHMIALMTAPDRPDEIEQAVLFKKDSRAVKTLLMADAPAVLADQGYCEITDTAKEG